MTQNFSKARLSFVIYSVCSCVQTGLDQTLFFSVICKGLQVVARVTEARGFSVSFYSVKQTI